MKSRPLRPDLRRPWGVVLVFLLQVVLLAPSSSLAQGLAEYGAEYTTVASLSLSLNVTRPVPVTVTNTSTVPWPASTIALHHATKGSVSNLGGPCGDGPVSLTDPIPIAIPPGGSWTFTVQ